MRTLIITLVALTALAASGCVTASSGVAASTSPLEPGTYQRQSQTVGTSWGVQFLGFLPLAFASTKEAVHEATMEGRGHALADVTVDNTYYNWLIFTAQRIKVEGTAVTTQ